MKKIILLLSIICIAAILRFYQIGINPPSMSWDEVAFGYNAYSLGIDGRDEFGRLLPHDYLESFGDFKPPMYAYLDVLPVKVFGLTVFATRFPSALLGTLTVLITFFLTKTLFGGFAKKEQEKKIWGIAYEEALGLLAAFFLAISPWHVMLSRAGWEANVATFFLVTGIWLFLKAVGGNMWYLTLSAVSFVGAVYTFNTSRVFGPLIIGVLAIIFWKKLWQYKKQTVVAAIVGLVILLPTLPHLLSPQAKLRFQEVNIFSDSSVVQVSNQEIANDHNASWSKVIHNRRVLYGLDFLKHYFDNLSMNFLFIQGDGNPKFALQDMGQMYLWDLPFLIAGAFFLFRKKQGFWYVLPLWLLLGIIPAATARETPHALRIETTLPTFQILTAYGVFVFFTSDWLKYLNKRMQKAVLIVLAVVLLSQVTYYVHDLFIHYPVKTSGTWLYGYQTSIAYAQTVQDRYTEIDVTQSMGRPYIYYLFFTKTDPREFRKTATITRDAFGFVSVEGFGKYRFPTSWPKELRSNVLYINTPDNIPGGAHIQKTFKALNGDEVLVAYTK